VLVVWLVGRAARQALQEPPGGEGGKL